MDDSRDYSSITQLYSHPIDSTRSGPFYNSFSYPTKISPEAIALFISTHTYPGDCILDPFGGSGSTGLATLLCSNPTPKMIEAAERLSLKPQWGPRKAVIVELSTYASFASNVLCNPPDATSFASIAKKFISEAESKFAQFYNILDNDGRKSVIRHIIWTDVLKCSQCGQYSTFADVMIDFDPLKMRKVGICPHCSSRGVDNFKPVFDECYDPLLNETIERRRRVPFKIYGQTGSDKWHRMASQQDIDNCLAMEQSISISDDEPRPLILGDLYRSGYHKGITHLHHMYTNRNYVVMKSLWDLVSKYPPEYQDSLKLLLLSYNSSHSTLMTRVVLKSGQKDFVLTGSQSGVLYISEMPVEKNILFGLKRKIKPFYESFKLVNSCQGSVQVINGSSTSIPLPDSSVDYVFTDPPFGGFIPYSEVNQINELWLNNLTEKKCEVIISDSQDKGLEDYARLMKKVFKEISRVTCDDSLVSVVFHSSSSDVWNSVNKIFTEASFSVLCSSVLNKTQSSFKQIVSEASVDSDPILLLHKQSIRPTVNSVSLSDIAVDPNFEGYSTRQLYSYYVSSCIQNNVVVELDAKQAYELIESIRGSNVN